MALDEPDSDLIVATPERVTFDYPLAGPGSRFLAQLIDFPIQIALIVVAGLGAFALAQLTHDTQLAVLSGLVLAFFIVWGYFLISEVAWSGKTVGKYAIGLRVVGDQGEPLRFSQAAIRNLVRIVDFLPLLYGIGILILFVNGRGKRLGDLAAGTVVVRERGGVRLSQLPVASAAPELPRLAPAESALVRGLDPELRRFVLGYAERRPQLDPWRRHVLAAGVEPSLRRVLPDVVATRGPEAALDQLADLTIGNRNDV